MFRADNFSVVILILMAFTVIVIRVRLTKPLENTWPLIYWVLILFFTVMRPEDTCNLGAVLVGVLCGFLLRYEFMNRFFIRLVRYIEYVVWTYVLLRSLNLVIV
jgi:hypothetical protein